MIALVHVANYNGTVTTFLIEGRSYRDVQRRVKRKANGKRFRFRLPDHEGKSNGQS